MDLRIWRRLDGMILPRAFQRRKTRFALQKAKTHFYIEDM